MSSQCWSWAQVRQLRSLSAARRARPPDAQPVPRSLQEELARAEAKLAQLQEALRQEDPAHGHRHAQPCGNDNCQDTSSVEDLRSRCRALVAKNRELDMQVGQYKAACGALQRSTELEGAWARCSALEARNRELALQLDQLQALAHSHKVDATTATELEQLRTRCASLEADKRGLSLQVDQFQSLCGALQAKSDDSEQFGQLRAKCASLVAEKEELALQASQIQALVRALQMQQEEPLDSEARCSILEAENEALSLQVDQLQAACRAGLRIGHAPTEREAPDHPDTQLALQAVQSLSENRDLEVLLSRCEVLEAEKEELMLQTDQLRSMCNGLEVQAAPRPECEELLARCQTMEWERDGLKAVVKQLRSACGGLAQEGLPGPGEEAQDTSYGQTEAKRWALKAENDALALREDQLHAAYKAQQLTSGHAKQLGAQCERLAAERALLALQVEQLGAAYRALQQEGSAAAVALPGEGELRSRCAALEAEREELALQVEQLQAACDALGSSAAEGGACEELRQRCGVLEAERAELILRAHWLQAAQGFLRDQRGAEEAKCHALEVQKGALALQVNELQGALEPPEVCGGRLESQMTTPRLEADRLEPHGGELQVAIQSAGGAAQLDEGPLEASAPRDLALRELQEELARTKVHRDQFQEVVRCQEVQEQRNEAPPAVPVDQLEHFRGECSRLGLENGRLTSELCQLQARCQDLEKTKVDSLVGTLPDKPTARELEPGAVVAEPTTPTRVLCGSRAYLTQGARAIFGIVPDEPDAACAEPDATCAGPEAAAAKPAHPSPVACGSSAPLIKEEPNPCTDSATLHSQLEHLTAKCTMLESENVRLSSKVGHLQEKRYSLEALVEERQARCTTIQASARELAPQLRGLRERCEAPLAEAGHTELEAGSELLALQLQGPPQGQPELADTSDGQLEYHRAVCARLEADNERLGMELDRFQDKCFALEAEKAVLPEKCLGTTAGQMAQLEQLQAQCDALEVERDEMAKAKMVDAEKLQNRCEAVEAERASLTLQVEQLQAECGAMEALRAALALHKELKSPAALERENAQHVQRTEELRERLEAAESQRAQLELQVQRLQAESGEAEAFRAAALVEQEQLRERCKTLSDERGELALQVEQVRAECRDAAEASQQVLLADREKLRYRCGTLEDESAEHAHRADKFQAQCLAMEAEVPKAVELEELRARCRVLEVEMGEYMLQVEQLQGKCGNLDAEKGDLMEQVGQLQGKCSTLEEEKGTLEQHVQHFQDMCIAMKTEKAELNVCPQAGSAGTLSTTSRTASPERAASTLQLPEQSMQIEFEHQALDCNRRQESNAQPQDLQAGQLEMRDPVCGEMWQLRAKRSSQEPEKGKSLQLGEIEALDAGRDSTTEFELLLARCGALEAERDSLMLQASQLNGTRSPARQEEVEGFRDRIADLLSENAVLAQRVEELPKHQTIIEQLQAENGQLRLQLGHLQGMRCVLEAQQQHEPEIRDELQDLLPADAGADRQAELTEIQGRCTQLEVDNARLSTRLTNLLEQQDAEVVALQARVSQLEDDKSGLATQHTNLRSAHSKLLQEHETVLGALQSKCRRLEEDKSDLDARHAHLEGIHSKVLEQYRAELEALHSKCRCLEEDKRGLVSEHAELKDARNKLLNWYTTELRGFGADCSELEHDNFSPVAHNAGTGATSRDLLEQLKAELKAELETLRATNRRLEGENSGLIARHADLGNEHRRLLERHEADLEDVRARCRHLEDDNTALATQRASSRDAGGDLLEQCKAELRELRAKYSSLEDDSCTLAARHADLRDASATLLEQREKELEELGARCERLESENRDLAAQRTDLRSTEGQSHEQQEEAELQATRPTSHRAVDDLNALQGASGWTPGQKEAVIEELQARCSRLEADNGALVEQMLDGRFANSKLLSRRQAELEGLHAKCLQAEATIEELQGRNAQLQASAYEAQVAALESERLQASLNAAEAENSTSSLQVVQLQAALRWQEDQREQVAREAQQEASGALAILRHKVSALEAEKAELATQVGGLTTTCQRLKVEKQALTMPQELHQRCSDLEAERDHVALQVERLGNDYALLERQYIDLQGYADRASCAQDSLQQECDKLHAKAQEHNLRAREFQDEHAALTAETAQHRELTLAMEAERTNSLQQTRQVREELERQVAAREAAQREAQRVRTEAQAQLELVEKQRAEGEELRAWQAQLLFEKTALEGQSQSLAKEAEQCRAKLLSLDLAKKRVTKKSEVLRQQAEQHAAQRGTLEAETFRIRAENAQLASENAKLHMQLHEALGASAAAVGQRHGISPPTAIQHEAGLSYEERALCAAERWVLYSSGISGGSDPIRKYPGGVSVDLRELSVLIGPANAMAGPSCGVWVAKALERGAAARAMLQAYRTHDQGHKGFLKWKDGEVQAFIEAVFRQHGLLPPKQDQVYDVLQLFDSRQDRQQDEEICLDARTCLCMADALLRATVTQVEVRPALVAGFAHQPNGLAEAPDLDSPPCGSDSAMLADLKHRLKEAERAAERATVLAAGACVSPGTAGTGPCTLEKVPRVDDGLQRTRGSHGTRAETSPEGMLSKILPA